MKSLLAVFIFFIGFGHLSAQIERTLFESFSVDSVEQITIKLPTEETEFVFWPGNTILIETNIAFYFGKKSIFESLIKSGRYGVDDARNSTSMNLSLKNPTLKAITNQDGGSCLETISRIVYVPEDYVRSGEVFMKVIEDLPDSVIPDTLGYAPIDTVSVLKDTLIRQ